MESMKMRLRTKRGRSWDYTDIEIPTEAEMERIADKLHKDHVPALITVLGWKVLYVPACPLQYSTTELDLFTGERGETVQYEASAHSYCVFGYNAGWRVCYSWNQGDERPPARIHENGDVVATAETVRLPFD